MRVVVPDAGIKEQVFISHESYRMWLLVPEFDTCFWHNIPYMYDTFKSPFKSYMGIGYNVYRVAYVGGLYGPCVWL